MTCKEGIRQGSGFSLWLDNHPDAEPDWSMIQAEYMKHVWGYGRTRAIAEIRSENGITWREARESVPMRPSIRTSYSTGTMTTSLVQVRQ
jgi:hypothetical protein